MILFLLYHKIQKKSTGDMQWKHGFFIGFPEVITLGENVGLLARASRIFDVPGDVLGGLPRIELIGTEELRMEQHRGILSYGPDEIHVSGGKLVVRIRGNNLELRAMTPSELLITGEIRMVELV